MQSLQEEAQLMKITDEPTAEMINNLDQNLAGVKLSLTEDSDLILTSMNTLT